jgi:hypothetical protein
MPACFLWNCPCTHGSLYQISIGNFFHISVMQQYATWSYICMHACVCVYVCMYVCMYPYVWVCISLCLYIHNGWYFAPCLCEWHVKAWMKMNPFLIPCHINKNRMICTYTYIHTYIHTYMHTYRSYMDKNRIDRRYIHTNHTFINTYHT